MARAFLREKVIRKKTPSRIPGFDSKMEGTEESDTDRMVREIWGVVCPSKWKLERMYLNTIERFGAASIFTATITGGVLFLTGFAGVAEHATSGDWILMIGGVMVPVLLKGYWELAGWRERRKMRGLVPVSEKRS